jgi:hypothetical protein
MSGSNSRSSGGHGGRAGKPSREEESGLSYQAARSILAPGRANSHAGQRAWPQKGTDPRGAGRRQDGGLTTQAERRLGWSWTTT